MCLFMLVFVFFFFFKQKTAYEMRISDWSSDVCSSDLFAAERAIADDVARARLADVQQRQAVDGDPHLGEHRGQRHRVEPRRLDRARGRAEIGRASGRERVWQYV